MKHVRSTFPAIESIADDELRASVERVWARALADSTFTDLSTVPWWPPMSDPFDEPIRLQTHINDVSGFTAVLVDEHVDRFDVDVDPDVAIAGALLHDVSKLYELSGTDTTELNEWLPHPYYAIHVLAAEDCSLHLQHIALSHSQTTAVAPRTLEARIVASADDLAVDALYAERTGSLYSSGEF